MTNGSGAVTASLTLSAFGQTVASTGSSTSVYQFGASSGYRAEGDAGLTLVGCRFYDAQVGRFISRDTYLDQAPYAYCDGDPVNRLDPSGHSPVETGIAGGVITAVVFFIVAVVIEGVTAGAATPILVGIVAGGLSGAAGSATMASFDGKSGDQVRDDAIEGGIAGAVVGVGCKWTTIAEKIAAGGVIAE